MKSVSLERHDLNLMARSELKKIYKKIFPSTIRDKNISKKTLIDALIDQKIPDSQKIPHYKMKALVDQGQQLLQSYKDRYYTNLFLNNIGHSLYGRNELPDSERLFIIKWFKEKTEELEKKRKNTEEDRKVAKKPKKVHDVGPVEPDEHVKVKKQKLNKVSITPELANILKK